MKLKNPGYHLKDIKKGQLGEFSKIKEEFEELEDAQNQNCKIMELVELSDLIGAINFYIHKQYNLDITDLLRMEAITQRAFENGRRK